MRSKKKDCYLNLEISNNTFKYINEKKIEVLNYFTFIHYVIVIQTYYRKFRSKKLYKQLKKDYAENAMNFLKQKTNGKAKFANAKRKLFMINNLLSFVSQNSSDDSQDDNNNNNNKIFADDISKEIYENSIKGYYKYKNSKHKYHGSYKIKNIENSSNEVKKKNKKIKNGFGKISYADNSYVLSYFKNNKSNGITKYYNKEFHNCYYGEYKDGIPNGYGLFKDSHKTTYEGYFKKNILNGISEIKYSDGSYYQGNIINDQKNGIGFYRWSDGSIYIGEFYNDNMKGYCIIYYNNETMYQGQIESGKKNGYGEFTWGVGQKYIGYYKDDLKDGFGIFISNIKPLNVYIGFWKEGKFDGIGMTIINNQQKCGIYKNGKLIEKLLGSWAFKDFIYNPHLKESSSMNRTSSILSLATLKRTNNKFSPIKRNYSKGKARKQSSKKENRKIMNELNANEAFVTFMMQNTDFIKRFIYDKYIKDYLGESNLKRPVSNLLM